MRYQPWYFALLVLVAVSPARAFGPHAAPGSGGLHGVSRDDAIRFGAARGPGVETAAAALPATREAATAATRLLRPPILTLTGGYRGAAVSTGPEVGVSLSQDLPLADVRARRKELAHSWDIQAHQDLRQATLEAALRAALAWSACLEADAVWLLRQRAKADAERIWQLSQVRVKAGTALPSEEALGRSELATATAAALDGEGGVIETYAELRLALGLPVDAALTAVGTLDVDAGAEPPPPSLPSTLVDAHPVVMQAQARARLARSQTELVTATLGPNVTLGAAYLREGGGTQVVTGFVGLPLPFTQPAAFDRARERGQQRRLEAEVAQARAQVAKNVNLAAHDRVHWRETAAALRVGASAAREALRVVLANFEAGTLDVSPVLVARQRWTSTEEQALHAAGEVQRADIRFEALTGHLLEGVAP